MAKSTTTKDHQQGIDGGRLEITSGVALAEAVGFDTDSDQDGVPDILELAVETDPADAQSFLDSDNDGLSDTIDTDTDGDGISNINESGVFPYYDRDQDGVPAYLDDNDYNNRVVITTTVSNLCMIRMAMVRLRSEIAQLHHWQTVMAIRYLTA